MKFSIKTDNPHKILVESLYSAVDARDAERVGAMVSDDVVFQLGNFDALHGRQAVIDANAAFFKTIAGMDHTVSRIVSEGETVFCAGSVHYIRQDDTELEIPFATALALRDGLITDYRIYVDVSPL